MTFYAALMKAPGKIYATTEEDSEVLLVPVQHLNRWLKNYPGFNEMFYDQYDTRYSDLLDTIGHLLVDRMDKSLHDHLKKKAELINGPVKMSHNQITNEIGTSCEVVTRILKRPETEGKVIQVHGASLTATAMMTTRQTLTSTSSSTLRTILRTLMMTGTLLPGRRPELN